MKLNDLNLTEVEIKTLQFALPKMSGAEKLELLEMLEERERRMSLSNARLGMLDFAKHVYPGFKIGPHHKKLAGRFTDVIEGRKKRVEILAREVLCQKAEPDIVSRYDALPRKHDVADALCFVMCYSGQVQKQKRPNAFSKFAYVGPP